jgi:hypothetical protein
VGQALSPANPALVRIAALRAGFDIGRFILRQRSPLRAQ